MDTLESWTNIYICGLGLSMIVGTMRGVSAASQVSDKYHPFLKWYTFVDECVSGILVGVTWPISVPIIGLQKLVISLRS
jgi:hypothetical protein